MVSAFHNRALFLVALAALFAAILVPASSAGAAAPTCFGRSATIVAVPGQVTYGTPGPDVIVGTSGPDVIRSRGGADLICSLGGADRVYSGGGADTVDLGGGEDFARGGRGNDYIEGGNGGDVIKGTKGHDTLKGESGTDECAGGLGNDSLQSCNEAVSGSLSAAESQMVSLIQNLRSQHGAGSLRVSSPMSTVARNWSQRLPSGFFHNPSVGSQIPSGWSAWGENIAYNGSVASAFEALRNSPGHFNNMVNPAFTHVGVGVHVQNGWVYVTQVFARY
ncbi:MAG: CAP domain-containing protein [Acidimicrobiales bacterium]